MSLRCLQSVAFVPLEHVYSYFCINMATLEPTVEMQTLIMYFVNTYIGPRHIIENEPPIPVDDMQNNGNIIFLNKIKNKL
jgi:hypothetical protein